MTIGNKLAAPPVVTYNQIPAPHNVGHPPDSRENSSADVLMNDLKQLRSQAARCGHSALQATKELAAQHPVAERALIAGTCGLIGYVAGAHHNDISHAVDRAAQTTKDAVHSVTSNSVVQKVACFAGGVIASQLFDAVNGDPK